MVAQSEMPRAGPKVALMVVLKALKKADRTVVRRAGRLAMLRA